jgi:hypothetical protein
MAVARKNRDGRSTQRPARRCRGPKRLGRASDRTGRAGTVFSANPTLPASSSVQARSRLRPATAEIGFALSCYALPHATLMCCRTLRIRPQHHLSAVTVMPYCHAAPASAEHAARRRRRRRSSCRLG